MTKEILKNEHHLKAFNSVIEYIEENLNENISLETVADIANTSKFHFHRLFKEYFRESLSDYIKKRRLSYAAYLLVDSKRKIEDIALEMNYSTIGSFTRAFSKQFKITPAEYRRINIIYPYQITPKLSLERLLFKPPIISEQKIPDIKLIGFKQKGYENENHYETDKDYVELYWEFMMCLQKHNYPVKDGRLYHVNKTIKYKSDPTGIYYKECENFFGVLYNGCNELSHLPQITIEKRKYLNFSLPGPSSEHDKIFSILFENHFPSLPYIIDMSYSFDYCDIGLNGEMLNSSGNLDYEKMFNYFFKTKYEDMYFNSTESTSHFYIPYYYDDYLSNRTKKDM